MPAKGDAVRLSALVAAKIELHNAMLAERVGKYRLGKKLDWHLPRWTAWLTSAISRSWTKSNRRSRRLDVGWS